MLNVNKKMGSVGVLLLLSACGQTPATVSSPAYMQTSPYNNPYNNVIPPVNPMMMNPNGVSPIVNTVNQPVRIDPFTIVTTTASIPIYSNGQTIGTRTRKAILGGSSANVRGGHFEQAVPVNAGDHVVVNLESASYGASRTVCEGTFGSVSKSDRVASPLNLSASFNGQNLADGIFIAPASGTVVVFGEIEPFYLNCGKLFLNRPARILTFFVNLSTTGNEAAIGTNTLEIERCTNMQGAPMDCPAPVAPSAPPLQNPS